MGARRTRNPREEGGVVRVGTNLRHEKLLAFFLLRGVTLFSVGLCTQEGAHLRCGVRKGVHRAVVLSGVLRELWLLFLPGRAPVAVTRGEQARTA